MTFEQEERLVKAFEAIAKGLTSIEQRLSHEICLGIRHGLFGTSADGEVDIDATLGRVASAIEDGKGV